MLAGAGLRAQGGPNPYPTLTPRRGSPPRCRRRATRATPSIASRTRRGGSVWRARLSSR